MLLRMEEPMSARQSIAVLLVFAWLAQDVAMAGQKLPRIPKDGRLSWAELGPVAVDRKAKVLLSDGTKVEGPVLAVRPASLVLEIAKTSDKHAWPKGQTEIPRTSVSQFRLVKDSGPGKLVGGILGTVGGIMTTGAIVALTESAGALVAGLFVAIPAMAVGGYYLGKLADVRTRLITIVPDEAQVEEE
jgi:hypothetical protein